MEGPIERVSLNVLMERSRGIAIGPIDRNEERDSHDATPLAAGGRSPDDISVRRLPSGPPAGATSYDNFLDLGFHSGHDPASWASIRGFLRDFFFRE